jgi:hypothetical protein
VRGEFDLVVAMYHDQGLIPVKLLDRDRAVNVTVGLPVIRTSPDHGTAFDIAGMDKADPGSMRAAIELAVQLAQRANALKPGVRVPADTPGRPASHLPPWKGGAASGPDVAIVERDLVPAEELAKLVLVGDSPCGVLP